MLKSYFIRRVLFVSAAAFGAMALTISPSLASVDEISFDTIDGVKLYGDWHLTDSDKNRPLILLFHQAGSNARAEYASIWPILNDEGYNVLAIDARKGGSRLGGVNRTTKAFDESKLGYCDAYPDLEATLAHAKSVGHSGPIVVWGSSYSAALVLKLSHEHSDDIAATLAFSPASGSPMKGCGPNGLADKLTSPTMILRPKSEMAREGTRAQFKLFKDAGHETFVAENGVHGSSMLNPDRIKGSNEATWSAVKNFLKKSLANK